MRRSVCAGNAPAQGCQASQAARIGGSSHRSRVRRVHYSRHAREIARDHCQLEVLVYPLDSAIHRLPDPTDRLAPSEMLLDTLADDLTHPVSRVPRCTVIDRAAALAGVVACDMRGYVARPAIVDEIMRVVRLVGTDCLRVSARHAVEQSQRTGPLAKAICMACHGADHQPGAVLHQDMPLVTEDGRALLALLEQARICISARLMRLIATPLAFPVSLCVAPAAGRRIVRSVLATKTLVTRPCLDERAVHREMLVGQQTLPVG